MDFLSLSRGGKFDDAKQPLVGWAAYPYTGRSGYECMPGYISDDFGPFGRNIEPVAQIKAAVNGAGYNTPVVVIGGIHGFQQAEALIREGERTYRRRPPESCRPRLVPETQAGEGGPGKSVRIYQLLRRVGYQAQTGNLPVMGPASAGYTGCCIVPGRPSQAGCA